MCCNEPAVAYYGLRSYGIEPQVWGGDPNCCHDFGDEGKSGQRLRNGIGSDTAKVAFAEILHPSTGAFCRCGAWKGDLGLEPDLGMYLDHMVEIMRAVWRVMRKDATCWLNIGDSYANASQGNNNGSGASGLKRNVRDEAARLRCLAENKIGRGHASARLLPHGFKPKDLMLIPWRLANRLQEDGWWVRSAICWSKRAPMPESCTDRPTSAWEPVFLLMKSGSPQFWTHRDRAGSRTKPAPDYRWVDHDYDDAETDVEPPNWRMEPAKAKKITSLTSASSIGYAPPGQAPSSNARSPKRWSRINQWQAHDYFYDAEAVKEAAEYGENRGTYAGGNARILEANVCSGGVTLSDKGMARQKVTKRNLRNVWTLGPEPFPESHFAVFPTEIPRRCINAGTSETGVCLKCGAPWCRVTRVERVAHAQPPGRGGAARQNAYYGEAPRDGGAVSSKSMFNTGLVPVTDTIAWQPSCQCNAGAPVPATVLDCFLGAGTTALVADRLGRHCIGIELSQKYATMAERRLRRDAPLLVDIAAE